MWLRPSPSDCSLPTISWHLFSTDAASSLPALVLCAAWDGVASAMRESTSTIVLILVSKVLIVVSKKVSYARGQSLAQAFVLRNFCDHVISQQQKSRAAKVFSRHRRRVADAINPAAALAAGAAYAKPPIRHRKDLMLSWHRCKAHRHAWIAHV